MIPASANADRLVVVLIDVQPAFLDSMSGATTPLLARLGQLLIVSRCLEIPIIATLEEPTERKGALPEPLQRLLPESAQCLSKRTYDLCRESHVTSALAATGRTQVAVAGAETDVCVLQSVLGLRRLGMEVFLIEDCLFSSAPRETTSTALRRMELVGAIPCTYKTLFYELCVAEKSDRWARVRPSAEELGFVAPESV